MANEGIMALPQGQQMQGQQMQGKGLDMDALNKAAPRAGAYKDIGKTLQELDPRMVAQYKAAIAPMLQKLNLAPEQINAMIQMFDYMSEHRDQYSELLADLIQQGILKPGDLPEQFDATLMAVLQLVLHELQGQAPSQDKQGIGALPQGQGQSERPPFAMKKGGLVQAAHRLQSQGRNGDTILAHINPQEAAMLKAMGGSGTINPATGLREYGFFSSVWHGITGAVKSVGNAIGSAVSSVVGAVKDVVASPVGKILATIALTYFLGPAGAGFFSSTAMAAGVASAGLTAVGGGSPADIVKSGLMAYAGASAMSAMSSAAGVPPGTPGGPPPVSPEALPPTVTPDGLPDAVPAPQAPPVINSVGNAQQLLSSPPPSVSPTGGAASLYRPGDEFMNTTPAPSVSPEATAPPPQVSAEPNLSAPNPAVSAPAPVPQGAPAPNAPIGGTGTNGIGDLATKASDAVFGHTPTSAEISAEAVKLQQATPGLSTDKAIDIATKNLTPSTLRSVVPATLLGGALLSKTSLTQHTPVDNNPLGLKPKTSADYMAENPQFAAWENGWKTAGAAPTPQAPGPTTMTPTTMAQFSPYTLPALNQAPRPAVNQPYNTAGLYGLYGQPTQQMNMGGPVNDAHTSGSGMQQGLTNAFNGGGGMSSNGGIGALSPSSFAEGGNTHYPRRTGPIDGPGTGTSDSIPAMLSDGEFVFTAKAVKRAGNGSRREGAKRMYQLMHMLEHGGKV